MRAVQHIGSSYGLDGCSFNFTISSSQDSNSQIPQYYEFSQILKYQLAISYSYSQINKISNQNIPNQSSVKSVKFHIESRGYFGLITVNAIENLHACTISPCLPAAWPCRWRGPLWTRPHAQQIVSGQVRLSYRHPGAGLDQNWGNVVPEHNCTLYL
jgi:hypothetical protein